MKIINFLRKINLVDTIIVKRVVAPDNIIPHYEGQAGIEITDLEDTPYKGQDLTGKSLLISRFGGGGDLLFISAVARQLKKKYPNSTIDLACDPNWLPLFRQNTDYTNLYNYPYSPELVYAHDYYLTFEGIIEGDGEGGQDSAAGGVFA